MMPARALTNSARSPNRIEGWRIVKGMPESRIAASLALRVAM